MFPGSETRARVRLHRVRPLRHAPRPAPGQEPPPAAAATAAETSVAAAGAGWKRGAEVAAGLLQREYILPCGLLQREQQRDHGDQLQHRAGDRDLQQERQTRQRGRGTLGGEANDESSLILFVNLLYLLKLTKKLSYWQVLPI